MIHSLITISSSQKSGVAGGSYLRNYDAINKLSSSSVSEDSFADAASEKELVGVVGVSFVWILLKIAVVGQS